jgi:hypothetical protein
MTSLARTLLFLLARALLRPAIALIVLTSIGCSNGSSRLPGVSGRSSAAPNLTGPIDTGDACTTQGAQTACGTTVRQEADYVVCAVGVRTCQNGTWGDCVTTGQRQIQSRRDRLQTVGTTKACGSWNPCDPFCQEIDDNSNTVTPGADAGYLVDGGVTLKLTKVEVGSTSCTSLKITPNSSTLTINQLSPTTTSPSQVTVSAELQPSGCYPATTPVLWSIDRTDIATIDSTGKLTLVTPISTPIVITGHSGNFTGNATVQVSVNVADNHLAPVGTATKFTGASSVDTTTLLYPYAQTVLPLGLPSPLLQWSTGANGAAAAVKISLRFPAATGASFNWSAIVPENSTLVLDPGNTSNVLAAGPRRNVDTVDTQVWRLFERTALGQDAAIVIQRLTGTSPYTLRDELSTTIHFASNQLKGTVYYHSYGTNLVKNFGNTYPNGNTAATLTPPPPATSLSQDYGGNTLSNQLFGAATLMIQPGATTPSVAAGYTTNDTTGKGCRVCHSASATAQIPVLLTNLYPNTNRDSAIFRLGVDAPNAGLPFTPTPNNGKYAWGAVYPDGTMMLSNSGPSNTYRTATPPGGLDGGESSAFNNTLYSLNPSTLGNVIASTGMPPTGSSSFHAALPVFSIDGKKIAFNFYSGTNACKDSASAFYTGDKHSLAVMDFAQATSTFSNCRVILKESAACNSNYPGNVPCTDVWPAFLPTTSGDYGVVFEREVVNNGAITGHNTSDFGGTRAACDYSPGSSSYKCTAAAAVNDGSKGELWLSTSNAAAPKLVRLSAANGTNAAGTTYIPTGANNHTTTIEPVLDYEPTTAPQQIGGYYWVAFTSRRLYGNVATVNPWWSDPRWAPIGGQFGPTTKKIWVTAVDSDAIAKAGAGADPSHPPFYLPGQELLAGNAKAYWSIPACIQASSTKTIATLCDSNLDCCGAMASPATSVCALDTPLTNPPVRHCLPVSTSSCINDNSATACNIDAECCNNVSLGSICVNNVCQKPPPVFVYLPDQFSRNYQVSCSNPAQMPVWREVQWKGSIPAGASVDFSVQTADTEAGLATAVPTLALDTATSADLVAWTTSSKAVSTVFANAIPVIVPKAFVRLTIKLNPSPDKQSTPTITSWRQLFDCVDAI